MSSFSRPMKVAGHSAHSSLEINHAPALAGADWTQGVVDTATPRGARLSPVRHSEEASAPLKSLQILRAVASTSVVYYHIAAVPVFGSFGVDIFFVLSGFVMALVIENGQGARSFAVNRVARIVPLYWLLTTCLFVLAATKPELLETTTANLSNYFKSIFFIPHFKENGLLHPMLTVGWSLNYEMFFYGCVWLAIVLARGMYIQITLAILVAAFVFLGGLSSQPVLRGFFGTTLLFDFVLGMFAFRFYRAGLMRRLRGGRRSMWMIALLSFLFMAVMETVGSGIDRLLVYGVPSVLLVLSALELEQSDFMSNNRLVDALAAAGDASYATYLSHSYVVEGVRRILFQKLDVIDPYTPLGVAFILALALLVGQLVYVYLDKPLSRAFKNLLQSGGTRRELGRSNQTAR
jgi:exopolysaccharide production protein ExoZ